MSTMKYVSRGYGLLLMAVVLVFSVSCKNGNKTDHNDYNETTQELIRIVESDSRIKALLEEAIAKGKQINPDKKTNPAQSLEEYYAFVDYSQTAMPWDVIFCPGQPCIFGRMYHVWC